MKNLKGSHALVTGASRGLGVHITRMLAGEGVHLSLSARSESRLAEVCMDMRKKGINAYNVPADLTETKQIQKLVGKTEELLGPVDILVNNAGVESPVAFHKIPHDDIGQSIRVNLHAPMLLTRLLLPGMLHRNRGHIINISSLAGKAGFPYHTAYAATKAALIEFTHSLRSELRGKTVEASVICPGFIAGEGMYARIEQKAGPTPTLLKPTTMDKVTGAVLNALKENKADLIVNPFPMRPMLMFREWFTGLTPLIHKTIGLTDYASKLAERG